MTDTPPDTVPHSHEAERGLLSCCMQNPQELIPRARTRLAPDAFHHPAHATIWDWLLRLLDANKPIDLATLTNAIREAGTPPAVIYKPGTNYNGTDSFTFRVYNVALTSAAASVCLTVTPVNDAPTVRRRQ